MFKKILSITLCTILFVLPFATPATTTDKTISTYSFIFEDEYDGY